MRKVLRGALVAAALSGIAAPAFADPMAEAKAVVEKYAAQVTTWDGPTTGPKGAEGKSIVVLAGDLKNGGILGVTEGMKEAADVLGWKVTVIDGAGSVQQRTAAFDQALALKPDGIIINGFDAQEQNVGMAKAKEAGLPVVTWHAGPKPGPDPEHGIFSNVTTDATEVAKAAADWAFVNAEGKPGVIIFTDSCCSIALAKAHWMEDEIKRLGGTVLEFVDTPMADTSTRMPTLTTALLQKYGASWTNSLAINDIYYDFMGPGLAAAGIGGTDRPLNISAGDGSESAYERIRSGQYQAVTVAEPLNLQGWQVVDEMNRALSGAEPSGYVSPLHLVTKDNIAFDGGKDNRFDPENGYRDEYRKIWGK